jgi:soluble lytic murein transglycosylase-like protein
MNKRFEPRGILALTLVCAAQGVLCLSCNHGQRMADDTRSRRRDEVNAAGTMQWRERDPAIEVSSTPGKLDSVPEGTQDSSVSLDPSTEQCIRKYGPAVRRYAAQYGFDWRLILAIMKQESREFRRGEDRIAQLAPVGGEEPVRRLRLEGLSEPEHGIQTVIFYLRNLYDVFEGSADADRVKLMLAAYNAGLVRVYDAQQIAAYLHDRPAEWSAVRDALPLLSKRFYTLHRAVWSQGKPLSGWSDNSSATIRYVNAVMSTYHDFSLCLEPLPRF